MKKPQSLAGDMQTISPPKSRPILPVIACFLLFLCLGSGVEWMLFEYRQQQSAWAKAIDANRAETLLARLQAELNTVIYLSNAIAENPAIRQDLPDPDKMGKFFTDTFRLSRHVQSFAITKAYRIAYVFPPDDDGQTIDYDYKGLINQLPWIQANLETRTPLLAWTNPPERRLTYLSPIFEDGQFWGLLSTLINDSSLLSTAGLTQTTGEYQYSLRIQRKEGLKSAAILGSDGLFDDPKANVSSMTLLGDTWQLALKASGETPPSYWPLFFRVLGWIFAAAFAALALALWTLKRKLDDLALYDRLTELPSRHLFLDRLKQVIRRTKRNQGKFSTLFINLNEFSKINQSHGTKVGDMMLAGIGKRLIGLIRHCDTVTRWGGDEFLILLDECPHDQAIIIAENLRHQIELPIYCGELQLRVGAAIGLATFPDDGQSLAALLKVADAKMVKDKALHKN